MWRRLVAMDALKQARRSPCPWLPPQSFRAARDGTLAGRLLRSGHRLLALFDQLLRCGDILRIAAQG